MRRPASAFQRLSMVTAAATLGLIGVGAVVRATSSGLGCPDWPRCHGELLPPLQVHSVIEYSHRISAGIVGLLVLSLAVFAWVRFRSAAGIFWPSLAALVVVIFQGALGRFVVATELEGRLVAVHFATSLVLFGLTVTVMMNALLPRRGKFGRPALESALVAASIYVVGVLGAVVVQSGASLAFSDWPLMTETLSPSVDGTALLHLLHRLSAAMLGVGIAFLVIRRMRPPRDPLVVGLSHAMAGAWVLQVLIGGANVLLRLPVWAVAAHVLVGASLWGLAVAHVVASTRMAPDGAEASPPGPASSTGGSRVKAYFMLTKPRVIELLLITTVPAMIAAHGGWPPATLIAATLLGGALAAGGANAINCFCDRDIDEKMERTSARPLPAHSVEPGRALAFGIALSVLSFLWLAWAANMAAALYAAGAILFYVFVYTLWLKRLTPSNIVIGGAAGAVPVLVGWAAVTGRAELPAWILFAIIFYWTPPHFWALALRYADDYAAAGVPMLPVARGVPETTRHMLFYSCVLAGVSLVMYPVGRMGNLYLASAVILGAAFVRGAYVLHRRPGAKAAMSFFRWSITYLTLLFVSVGLDRLVGGSPTPGLEMPVLAAAAGLFFVFQGAILWAVLRSRLSPSGPSGRLAEAAWTLLPMAASAPVFVAAWQRVGG